MKGCELCRSPASMYCDSDQASLCWDCDSKVHSANFLVSRHSRTLLCDGCQAPTPWQASGAKLCPTISICSHCSESSTRGSNHPTRVRDSSPPQMVDDDEIDTEDEYSDDDEDATEIDEDEEADNQVVPWSTPLPPSASSSSSDQESLSGSDRDESAQLIAFSSKRARKSGANWGFQDSDVGCFRAAARRK